VINIVAVSAYGVDIIQIMLSGTAFYDILTQINVALAILRGIVWGCQVFSFSFLLFSTWKIRQLMMSHSALQRQIDKKMVRFMLVCIGVILLAYVSIYTVLLIFYVDPNIHSISKKEEDL
jgi:hypothetical protein